MHWELTRIDEPQVIHTKESYKILFGKVANPFTYLSLFSKIKHWCPRHSEATHSHQHRQRCLAPIHLRVSSILLRKQSYALHKLSPQIWQQIGINPRKASALTSLCMTAVTAWGRFLVCRRVIRCRTFSHRWTASVSAICRYQIRTVQSFQWSWLALCGISAGNNTIDKALFCDSLFCTEMQAWKKSNKGDRFCSSLELMEFLGLTHLTVYWGPKAPALYSWTEV